MKVITAKYLRVLVVVGVCLLWSCSDDGNGATGSADADLDAGGEEVGTEVDGGDSDDADNRDASSAGDGGGDAEIGDSGDVGGEDTGPDADAGGDEDEDAWDYDPEDNPLSEEKEELLDALRTADHDECQREGEGWPLGPCPEGCQQAPSPSAAFDVEEECFLTEEQLGGPSVCFVEGDYEMCGQVEDCKVDDTEIVGVYGGLTCWTSHPEGWSNLPICVGADGETGIWEFPDCEYE